MKNIFKALLATACLVGAVPSFACTSVIVSGKAQANGRPLMYKHRDTGTLDNRIERFQGPRFAFIGLVNSPSKGGEVWTGTNEAGFSIMNTASYNIKDDKVPEKLMDREGELMYKALGECEDLSDFEKLLDTMKRPMGVEANFGVIDAKGGAAYYEVNNHKWVKYDVNDEPSGYRVVTNFSFSGRPEDAQGVERYETACAVMKGFDAPYGQLRIGHSEVFNSLSRSYRHERLGIDLANDLPASGVAVDQDFIPRRLTSASCAVEGVKPGEDPLHTVMWTIVGYPACSVAIPLLVGKGDCIPSYLKKSSKSNNCELGDLAMSIKNSSIFTYEVGNGKHYFRADAILRGSEGRPALLECCKEFEMKTEPSFSGLFSSWVSGRIGDEDFYTQYSRSTELYIQLYNSIFGSYLKND